MLAAINDVYQQKSNDAYDKAPWQTRTQIKAQKVKTSPTSNNPDTYHIVWDAHMFLLRTRVHDHLAPGLALLTLKFTISDQYIKLF